MQTLKPGKIVTVYDNPITKTDAEGDAVLKEQLIPAIKPGEPSYWNVDFEDGFGIVGRWILP